MADQLDPAGTPPARWSRLRGVAAMPPGIPITNWNHIGERSRPSSASRRQNSTCETSKHSSSGFTPCSRQAPASARRNGGGLRNTPSPKFSVPASNEQRSGRRETAARRSASSIDHEPAVVRLINRPGAASRTAATVSR